MYDLKGKVVVITGAANGIGAAFVKLIVAQGTKHVRILDIDKKAGILLQDELNGIYGNDKVKFTKCDITKDAELFGAFDETAEQNGYIDLLVNNAGLSNESNSDSIRKEIEVNVTALINGTLKVIELMRKDKGGRGGTIINISSAVALIQLCPMLFAYSATKSAVLQFSNSIGKEPYYSKTGVRVITVCYGPTKTDILNHMVGFDKDIVVPSLYPMQTTEKAVQGTLEAYIKGESGSTWLVHNSKTKDITTAINKAYADLTKLLDD